MYVTKVPSTNGESTYTIRKIGDQFICSCDDHVHRSNGQPYLCKHLAFFTADLVSFATDAKKSKKASEILGV